MNATAERTKHTPGPWTAFYKQKYDEWHVSLPMSGGGMKLALAPDGIQSENREADARLIAAAPDMLAALQTIAAIYKRNNPMRTADQHATSCACMRCAVDAADAVIAKAEASL